MQPESLDLVPAADGGTPAGCLRRRPRYGCGARADHHGTRSPASGGYRVESGHVPDSRGTPADLPAHRRQRGPAHDEPPPLDPAAEHLQLRRGDPRIRPDGEGLFRPARLPALTGVRGPDDRVGAARQPGRVRQLRLRQGADPAHLLDVRHDADHPAGGLGLPAVRWRVHRVRPLQEGDDRTGHHELQGSPDDHVERHALHLRSDRNHAGEPDLHRRRRRGADVHRPPPIRPGEPGTLPRRGGDVPHRPPGA